MMGSTKHCGIRQQNGRKSHKTEKGQLNKIEAWLNLTPHTVLYGYLPQDFALQQKHLLPGTQINVALVIGDPVIWYYDIS